MLRAAAEKGDAPALTSPPYAGCYAGVNYYRLLVDALTREFPDTPFTFTLCCGDNPAIAHDALGLGFKSIICDCSDAMAEKLSSIAKQSGATLLRA